MTNPMQKLEALAGDLANARNEMALRAQAANKAINTVRANHRTKLTAALDAVNAANRTLLNAVKDHAGEFLRPKSRIFNDIRFGFKKRPGRIEIDNPEKTIELILRHFPKKASELLKSSVQIKKSALNALSAQELRKIGVTIEADTDEPFVRPVETSIDKVVAALLEDD